MTPHTHNYGSKRAFTSPLSPTEKGNNSASINLGYGTLYCTTFPGVGGVRGGYLYSPAGVSAKGLCKYYVIARGGGGSRRFITIYDSFLREGGSSHFITIWQSFNDWKFRNKDDTSVRLARELGETTFSTGKPKLTQGEVPTVQGIKYTLVFHKAHLSRK